MRGGESATVQRAGRVDQVNAADRGERATDNRRVERLGRETAGIEARLKETYDRLRAEVAKRIEQGRQAIRRGSEAAERASRTLGKSRYDSWTSRTSKPRAGAGTVWRRRFYSETII